MAEDGVVVNNAEPATDSATGAWNREPDHTPVYAIVSAVAEATDSDPLELPPLNEAIDPEALNDLFASRSSPAVNRVSFQYAGVTIEVRGSGDVRVRSEHEADGYVRR